MKSVEYLHVDEVATRWRETPKAVANKIRRGELSATKPGTRWLIDPADVEAFERSRTNALPVVPLRRRRRRKTL